MNKTFPDESLPVVMGKASDGNRNRNMYVMRYSAARRAKLVSRSASNTIAWIVCLPLYVQRRKATLKRCNRTPSDPEPLALLEIAEVPDGSLGALDGRMPENLRHAISTILCERLQCVAHLRWGFDQQAAGSDISAIICPCTRRAEQRAPSQEVINFWRKINNLALLQ